jgi:hypothetical protein
MNSGPRRLAPVRALLAALLVTPFGTASAIVISLVPDAPEITVGSTFGVQVLASDIEIGTEILSVYDLDILFDPTQFAFVNAGFGAGLGGPLDSEGAFSLLEPGRLDLFELSLLFDADLFALQTTESFTLATLTFQALAAGTANLNIDPAELYLFGAADAEGFPTELVLEGLQGATVVNAPPVAVPEPGSFLLMSLGLLMLGVRNRKRDPQGRR